MEDVITALAETGHLAFQTKDRNFIRSINRRVQDGEPLTTRQGFAFLRMLSAHPKCCFYLGLDEKQLQDIIQKAEWRVPCKASIWLKNQVRYMGDDVLAFRCTPGRDMEAEFHAMKGVFYGGVRLVKVSTASRLLEIVDFCGRWDFEMDEETELYLAGALNGRDRPSNAIVWENNIVVDVPDDAVLCQFVASTLGGQSL